jgi:hypothetical protein
MDNHDREEYIGLPINNQCGSLPLKTMYRSIEQKWHAILRTSGDGYDKPQRRERSELLLILNSSPNIVKLKSLFFIGIVIRTFGILNFYSFVFAS